MRRSISPETAASMLAVPMPMGASPEGPHHLDSHSIPANRFPSSIIGAIEKLPTPLASGLQQPDRPSRQRVTPPPSRLRSASPAAAPTSRPTPTRWRVPAYCRRPPSRAGARSSSAPRRPAAAVPPAAMSPPARRIGHRAGSRGRTRRRGPAPSRTVCRGWPR